MTEKTFTESQNDEQYTQYSGTLSDYMPTEQFGITQGFKPGDRVLDVGCNNARMFQTIREVHGDVAYTGIDIDERAIEFSRQEYPDQEFICDSFPSNKLKGRTFDTVISYAVYIMFQDWRGSLKKMASLAEKRIVLDLAMTMDYPTIDDPELSYVYYLDSGQRVPYVVHNAIHFINYCFTEHVNAGFVEIMATNPETTSALHGVPQDKFLRGIAIIHIDQTGKLIWGAQNRVANPEFMDKINPDDFRLPRATIEIDGKKSEIYPRTKIF